MFFGSEADVYSLKWSRVYENKKKKCKKIKKLKF